MRTKIENKDASRSVYDMITDRITEQLAKGIVPWHQPWAGGSALAISYRSRKPYSMLNIDFLLDILFSLVLHSLTLRNQKQLVNFFE